jgi:putative RecB family exonuclease
MCGQKFKYRYIDKIEEPETLEALTGKIVHRALELFYQAYRGDQCTTFNLQDCVAKAWMDFQDERATIGADRQAVEDLAHRIFQAEDPGKVDVVSTEQKLEVDLGGMVFRGIIDRVDRESDGSLTIVDYKTGKTPSASQTNDKLRQLMLYAKMYEAWSGIPVDRVKLIYLKGTPAKQLPITITAPVTAEGMAFIYTRSVAIGTAIYDACERDAFKPNKSFVCSFCCYKEMCPAWR